MRMPNLVRKGDERSRVYALTGFQAETPALSNSGEP
jgi:hypothetical protein